jgi:hypothetical protein
MKITFTNKLRPDYIQGILSNIHFTTFCLPFSSIKVRITMNKPLISLVGFVGLDVKLSLSSEGKKMDKMDGRCFETYC